MTSKMPTFLMYSSRIRQSVRDGRERVRREILKRNAPPQTQFSIWFSFSGPFKIRLWYLSSNYASISCKLIYGKNTALVWSKSYAGLGILILTLPTFFTSGNLFFSHLKQPRAGKLHLYCKPMHASQCNIYS